MFFDSVDIDRVFRNHLEGYESLPPNDAWDNIELTLTSKKKNLWKKYYTIAAFLVLFLVVGGLIAFFNFSFYLNKDSDIHLLTDGYSRFPNFMQLENPFFIDTVTDFQAYSVDPKHNLSQTSNERSELEEISDTLYRNDMNSNDSSLPFEKLKPKFAEISHQKTDPIELSQFNTEQQSQSSEQRLFAYNHPVEEVRTLDNTDEAKFAIGTQISPTISYRNTMGNPANVSANDEQSLITYAGGLNLGYKISKRLKISSGVMYAQQGQTLNNVKISTPSFLSANNHTAIAVVNGSIGINKVKLDKIDDEVKNSISRSELHTTQTSSKKKTSNDFVLNQPMLQRMEFVKIPLLLEYTVVDREVGVGMISGINTNLLVGQGIYMQNTLETNKVGSIKGLNRVNYSGTIGLSVSYDVNQNMQLSMQPMMDYFLNSFSSNTGKTFPYSFGLYTGLTVSF